MALSEPSEPAISIVVATRNRRHLLPRLISALEAQADAPPFEVIVVDDCSTDDTAEVIAELAAKATVEVRQYSLERNSGPAAARNLGWRAARSPLVAFTDDDCVPQPEWVAALAEGLTDHDLAQGKTERNPTQPHIGWFAFAPENDHEQGFYETCNMGYRASVLALVGGFDEQYGPRRPPRGSDRYIAPPWGEDTDLAWRAKAKGARTVFVSEAVVWHDVKRGLLRDALADLPRRSGTVYLVKRHPEVRAAFDSPLFLQAAHAPALGAVVAVGYALARPRSIVRWALAAAVLKLWAGHRTSYFPRRAWPRALPQWLLFDVADVALMAIASARNRTLLL